MTCDISVSKTKPYWQSLGNLSFICNHNYSKVGTDNVPVGYLALYLMVLRRPISIKRAIIRGRPWNWDFFGPWNVNERLKIITYSAMEIFLSIGSWVLQANEHCCLHEVNHLQDAVGVCQLHHLQLLEENAERHPGHVPRSASGRVWRWPVWFTRKMLPDLSYVWGWGHMVPYEQNIMQK